MRRGEENEIERTEHAGQFSHGVHGTRV
jgi:hypothetical protein